MDQVSPENPITPDEEEEEELENAEAGETCLCLQRIRLTFLTENL